jgi:hypothetical protein
LTLSFNEGLLPIDLNIYNYINIMHLKYARHFPGCKTVLTRYGGGLNLRLNTLAKIDKPRFVTPKLAIAAIVAQKRIPKTTDLTHYHVLLINRL